MISPAIRAISLILFTFGLLSVCLPCSPELISSRKVMALFILERANVSWELSLGFTATLMRARFPLDLPSRTREVFPPRITSLVVRLDTISRKVASTVDSELLVMAAITFSNADLSATNVVSLMPLTVRLTDITSGVTRKIIYIHISYAFNEVKIMFRSSYQIGSSYQSQVLLKLKA